MKYKYVLKKSMRKSIALRIKNGELHVSAPFFMTAGMINNFVQKHTTWIEKKLSQIQESILDPNKIDAYKNQAKEYIPGRVLEIATQFGLDYNSVKITSAKTRWGSCTSKKNLNFSYRLVLTPKEVIDYVIIHELAHTKHMNHSRDFRNCVASMMPEYKDHERYLRENGSMYII